MLKKIIIILILSVGIFINPNDITTSIFTYCHPIDTTLIPGSKCKYSLKTLTKFDYNHNLKIGTIGTIY